MKNIMLIKNYLLNILSILFGATAGLLIVILIFKAVVLIDKHGTAMDMSSEAIIKTVNATEIYPELLCGCCSKALDPQNICCGDMKQKIEYINKQVEKNLTKEEILLNASKEFGFNSLAKITTKQNIKNLLIASAPADAPKIEIEKTTYDLGQIKQSNGVASAIFDFTNTGKNDLTINKLTTSCGCTSASVIYKNEEGPTFTMPGHGKENPKNWSVSIPPGEKGQIKVYYDPNAHGKQKNDTISITRTISIFSNDPVEFEQKIKIELEQIQ